MKTREEKINLMIDDDIELILRDIHIRDYGFLAAVLGGDGWKPYNQLNDEQIDQEYEERKEHLEDASDD